MGLEVCGYVEVDAELFTPGVLEDALRRFLTGPDPVVIYHRNPAEVLGKVTRISGRGDRIDITAQLDPPPPRTTAADAYRKIASGTIRALALEGVFASNHVAVSALSISPLSPGLGTGFITSVEGSA